MKKLAIIFGGMSTENKVSELSAKSILKNLDKEKYEIYPIYIDEKGEWYKYINEKKLEKIENIIKTIKKMDVVFPVLHGLYGEDGSIQGMLELFKIPYVGCKILSSSISMDKAYTKIIFEKAGLRQTKYEYIKKYQEKYIYVDKQFNEKILTLEEITKKIEKNLKYPMCINKAKNIEQLKKYIQEAAKFDRKILIEEEIKGKEVECAVLGNENVIASVVGQIKSAEEFYSYNAKYKNQESKTEIPAKIPEEISKEIQKQAIKAFKAVDGKGLSRVDFFVEEKTNNIFINEINTMPGFTDISMYPKLCEASNISYKTLLNKIIELSQYKADINDT